MPQHIQGRPRVTTAKTSEHERHQNSTCIVLSKRRAT